MDIIHPDEVIEPGHTRRNLRKLEQQISRFEVSESLLVNLPKVMGQIAATGSKREKIAATRCIIAMVRANNPQPVQHQHLHQHSEDDLSGPDTSEGVDFEQRKQQLRDRIRRLTQSGGNGC
jgi:hypothetical protein